MASRFHLALPCLSISKVRKFYVDGLGATEGRSAQNWIDINLFGNQMTFTKCGPFNFDTKSYSFNGEILPSFHFGIILEREDWLNLKTTTQQKKIPLKSEVQFLNGKKGEHESFFIEDPNGFTVEFKCFSETKDVFTKA